MTKEKCPYYVSKQEIMVGLGPPGPLGLSEDDHGFCEYFGKGVRGCGSP